MDFSVFIDRDDVKFLFDNYFYWDLSKPVYHWSNKNLRHNTFISQETDGGFPLLTKNKPDHARLLRAQSATAKSSGGNVQKCNFASRAQRVASKNR